jgi:hypothetical protein
MFVIGKFEFIKKLKNVFIYTTSFFGIFFENNAIFALIILYKNGSFFVQNARIEWVMITAIKKYIGFIAILPLLRIKYGKKNMK